MVNPAYFSRIHTVKRALHVHTNAGSSSTRIGGYLGSHLFWMDHMGISNIVSLQSLEAKFHIMYDSKLHGGSFVWKMPKGEVVFRCC